MTQMGLSPEGMQRMMLTPKMLLSTHVLQLNIMDLRVFVRAELEENVLLEKEDEEHAPDEEKSRLDKQLSLLIDENPEDETPLSGGGTNDTMGEERKSYLQSLITKSESLYEHLSWQLEILGTDMEEKRIGDFIISNLDEDGFLNIELEEIRQRIPCDIKSFRHALNLVRSFDPVGIAARDLKESLLIQLISSGKGDTLLYRIVTAHFQDLERGNFGKIAEALCVPLCDVLNAKKRISYLSPRPAAAFGGGEALSIKPDVLLLKNNGAYEIEVNDQDVPRLTISRFYRSILKNKAASSETKDYIKNKLAGAQWLLEALDRRKTTIGRVCGHLADFQNDYLRRGDAFLKPLTLKMVAGELYISEATVSRVVSNKYALISAEMFALKDFFSGHLKTENGRIISDKVVKKKIQGLIEAEECAHPLSDEAIESLLHKEGIKISRRTVAKYRKGLKIPPFTLRRKSATE